MTHAWPLPGAARRRSLNLHGGTAAAATSLLLLIQDKAEHIETKLRELETHETELVFGLAAQDMTARRPEGRHRLTNGGIVVTRVLIDVAGVDNLALGGGVGAVDLAVRERLEGRHA
jgi:hypothetical protein